jgi:hypothetical protein
MNGTAIALLGLGCTVLGAVFGYIAFLRTCKKDSKDEGKENGIILTELGYIKANTEEIKRKQEKQDERHVEIIGRLTAVEASAEQAHKRLDRLEGREERE